MHFNRLFHLEFVTHNGDPFTPLGNLSKAVALSKYLEVLRPSLIIESCLRSHENSTIG